MSFRTDKRSPLNWNTAALRAALCLLLLAACLLAPAAEEEPVLEAHSAPDGTATLWLVSPALRAQVSELTACPRGAREGGAAPDGGVWQMHVSQFPYVDLSQAVKGAYQGAVWSCARLKSTGGRRIISAVTPFPLKLFLNGRLLIEKQASGPGQAEEAAAPAQLPAGESEVAIACGIRWGQSFYKLRLLDGNGARPADAESWLLPRARAAQSSAGALLAEAISFRSASAFVSDERGTELCVELNAGYPAGLGPLTPSFKGPAGEAIPARCAPRHARELAANAWRVALPVLKAPGCRSTVTCELRAGEQLLGIKKLAVFSQKAIRSESAVISRNVEQARQKLGRALPHAELAVEQLGLWMEQLAGGIEPADAVLGEKLLALLAEARARLEAEEAGRDPGAGRTGYFERAYASSIDGSPQPYFVLIPGAAAKPEPGRKLPLVVFLHGYVPDYDRHLWWRPFDEFNVLFEKHGALLVIPFGRSNTDFLGPGELDVLEVIEEMKRSYPVDESRIYLYGYSMGGMAVYSLAGHYPGLFRAGVVLAGRAWSPLLMGTGGIESLHPFKQFLVRADQPLDMCENLGNFPLRIFHGAQDQFVPAAEAELMRKRIAELGGQASVRVVQGDHYGLFDVMVDDEPVKWLLAQPPLPAWEGRSRNRQFSLCYARFPADFLADLRLSGAPAPFEVGYERSVVDGEPCVSLGTLSQTIQAFRLRGVRPLDTPALQAFRRDEAWFSRPGWAIEDERKDTIPWKTSKRCGPVKQAYCSPFLIVYGTGGGDETAARLKERAETLAREWRDFAKGRAVVKADREVNQQERESRNLVLVGEEQENLLHAEAARAGKLPFAVKDGQARIGDRSVSLKGRGLLYIYPSPFTRAERPVVVIAAGLHYGEYLPINHKLDLVPDFLVFTDQADPDGTRTNRPVAAGFFDGKWRLNSETTWWFGQ